jgi:putative nucleotidyltransferase with HDIG domain
VGQFWRHASARVTPDERAAAERLLGPGLGQLFSQLPINDQRHGLDVWQTLTRIEGQPERLVQQAALLHDIGKAGADFRVFERSLSVFLQAVSPRLLDTLLRLRPGFAQRYAVYRDHARIGAQRLEAAGAGELARIVAEHHAPNPQLDATRQLQQADRRH